MPLLAARRGAWSSGAALLASHRPPRFNSEQCGRACRRGLVRRKQWHTTIAVAESRGHCNRHIRYSTTMAPMFDAFSQRFRLHNAARRVRLSGQFLPRREHLGSTEHPGAARRNDSTEEFPVRRHKQ